MNTDEADSRLSSLLAQVEEHGEIVVICRNGKPVAEPRQLPPTVDPLAVHTELSSIEFREDPVAPLEPDDWPEAFE